MKKIILDCLDAASVKAETGIGYCLGADRLVALQYYAGVRGFPVNAGTGPSSQQARITQRFLELAQIAGLNCMDVRRHIQIDLGNGEIVYGLYGV